MKVYCSPYAPFPRRVLLYLAVKGITDVEVVTLITIRGETRTPQFLAKNFTGKVPLLETDEGELVHESQPILQFLEDRYPDPPMAGRNESERRRVELQSALINDFYYYAFLSSSNTHPYLSRGFKQSHDVDIATSPLWRMRFEQIAMAMGDDPFLAGDVPTIADCMLFGLVEYLGPLYSFFMPRHLKTLLGWYERFKSIPGLPLLEFPEWYYDEYIARYGSRT
jgi:glutathione S-transferase